jgi:hypothetical protein
MTISALQVREKLSVATAKAGKRERLKKRLAVLGDATFRCNKLHAPNLRRRDCGAMWAKWNDRLPRKNDVNERTSYGRAARIGSPCTRCEVGEVHASGKVWVAPAANDNAAAEAKRAG